MIRRTPGFTAGPALLIAVLFAGSVLATVTVPSCASTGTGTPRVLLDRLTWSPDGGHLAVEARSLQGRDAVVDTLLVDLSSGSITERNPRPLLAAFDPAGTRIATLTRHALRLGPAASPGESEVLATLQPGSGSVRRMKFTAGGDTLLLLRDTRLYTETVAMECGSGRQSIVDRRPRSSDAADTWGMAAPGEMEPVEPAPFGSIYLPVRIGLFFLERSMIEVQGLEGRWLYDLHFRNDVEGTEVLLARNFVPHLTRVSPDSVWLAVAGSMARPDYGGGVSPGLLLLSTDGRTVYTVRPEGAPAASLSVTAMAWSGGTLWLTTEKGLFRVDPEVGRALPVSVGPAAPAWTDSLDRSLELTSLVFQGIESDTSSAVPRREELRRVGFPAWIMPAVDGSAGYQVAVGAATRNEELEAWGAELTRLGIQDFDVVPFFASAAGVPFPHGTRRGPGNREAFFVAVGPLGRRAHELWITEKNGARRVRLMAARGAGAD